LTLSGHRQENILSDHPERLPSIVFTGTLLQPNPLGVGMNRREFITLIGGRPDLREAHARARLAWSDYWAERALTLSLDGSQDVFIDAETGKAVIDHAAVQRSRLAVDTIKWLTSKYAKKVYGDRPVPDEEPKVLTIRWQSSPDPVVQPPEQITHQKPELPADLSEQDWSIMLEILELVKRTVPTIDERPSEEIFGVMKHALLAHFRQI
jgi:hypothetical protein